MLPKSIGLTAAIFVAMLDHSQRRTSTILTPTLEELGLLKHETIKRRWQAAIQKQDDQRAGISRRTFAIRELAGKLEASADAAVTKAVADATKKRTSTQCSSSIRAARCKGAIETRRRRFR